jgi:hypothetical protein
MAANPGDSDEVAPRRNEPDPALFVVAARDLALFARQNNFSQADGLLTELLAVLYARKGEAQN